MHRRGTVSDRAPGPDARAAVPPPGEHGDDAEVVAAALGLDPAGLLDLAATSNPVAPDPTPVLARHLDAVRRYPATDRAVAALAEAMDVDCDRLVLTNGGAEAIALVAAEYPTGRVDEPEFSLYRRHLTDVTGDGPRWASNPHSPSGRLAGADETAFVWDEAFYPLSTGQWTRGDRDAVVVGSLTKLLACPGLRAGYVLARDAEEAERIAARRPAWSVNGLACAALPDLLDQVELGRWASEIAGLRDELIGCLTRHGFAVAASNAPWVLVGDSAGLRERLAPQGILVRDCTSFGLPDHTRIAVPDPDGLARLDAALAVTS